MSYLANLSDRAKALWVIALASLVLPQMGWFLTSSLTKGHWMFDRKVFLQPSDPYQTLLWLVMGLSLGLTMLAIGRYGHRSGTVGVSARLLIGTVLAASIPVLAFFMLDTWRDVGTWDSWEKGNPGSITSAYHFYVGYYVSDFAFMVSFLVVGAVAALLSMRLGSSIHGLPDAQAQTAVAGLSLRPTDSLADQMGLPDDNWDELADRRSRRAV